MKFKNEKIFLDNSDINKLISFLFPIEIMLKKLEKSNILYCEYNVNSITYELESLEYAITNYNEPKFIRGYELQKIFNSLNS